MVEITTTKEWCLGEKITCSKDCTGDEQWSNLQIPGGDNQPDIKQKDINQPDNKQEDIYQPYKKHEDISQPYKKHEGFNQPYKKT